MNVTLLRHMDSKKVLYMEAGKDFVDLLLSFLLLPVGTILNRLGELSDSALGGIANVAGSVAKLQTSFLNVDRSELLQPKVTSGSHKRISRSAPLLELSSEPDTVFTPDTEGAEALYKCGKMRVSDLYNYGSTTACSQWRSTAYSAQCPSCHNKMSEEVWMKEVKKGGVTRVPTRPAAWAGKAGKNGFVKKNITFIVTDDLEITPASTIKSIDLLNSMRVVNMSELESCEVRVGAQEALKLLAASFKSKNVLNHVFGPRNNVFSF